MITIWGFRDPYFRITCYILIKLLQLFGMPFQKLFANKWNLACRTINISLLIPDTMSTIQANAGNIILTLSKFHIRAIHHTLSEIGTKMWFGYQGIAIRRNYKVKNRWQRQIHLDGGALPISPLAATDPLRWWGYYLFHPWPWLRHLSSDLISHPALYRVQSRECLPHSSSGMFEEEKKINRHSTLIGSTSYFIAL